MIHMTPKERDLEHDLYEREQRIEKLEEALKEIRRLDHIQCLHDGYHDLTPEMLEIIDSVLEEE